MTPDSVSTLNLDWLASLACAVSAASFFVLHVISSPRRKHWMRKPQWVRLPLFLCGATLLYRSANLLSLAMEFPDGVGHITPVGLLAMSSLSCATAAMAVHSVSMAYSPKVWSRLDWIFETAACRGREGVRERATVDRLITRAAIEELSEGGAQVASPSGPWPAP